MLLFTLKRLLYIPMKAIFVILVLSFTSTVAQTTVGGVYFEATITPNETSLVLNGAGVREKWFIDLYAGALYLPETSQNVNEIIACKCPQAFRIVIISSLVTTEKFNDAIDEVFEKSTQGNTTHIDDRIKQFKSAIGLNLKKGDVLLLVSIPDVGLKVYRDGKYMDTILGFDFKQETMKLWLGPHCVDDDLKKKLLNLN